MAYTRFFGRDAAILDIAREAWLKRYVVTVITVSAKSRRGAGAAVGACAAT